VRERESELVKRRERERGTENQRYERERAVLKSEERLKSEEKGM
jgi:hypothetical protein